MNTSGVKAIKYLDTFLLIHYFSLINVGVTGLLVIYNIEHLIELGCSFLTMNNSNTEGKQTLCFRCFCISGRDMEVFCGPSLRKKVQSIFNCCHQTPENANAAVLYMCVCVCVPHAVAAHAAAVGSADLGRSADPPQELQVVHHHSAAITHLQQPRTQRHVKQAEPHCELDDDDEEPGKDGVLHHTEPKPTPNFSNIPLAAFVIMAHVMESPWRREERRGCRLVG